jgi:hypothetical protein
VFEKINKAHDGTLSTVEFSNGIKLLAPEADGNLYEMLKTFHAIDAAGEGKITREEFLANANRLKEWADGGDVGSSFEACSASEVAEAAAALAATEISSQRYIHEVTELAEDVVEVDELTAQQASWQAQQEARMKAEKQTKQEAEQQAKQEAEQQAKQEAEQQVKLKAEEEEEERELVSSRSRTMSSSLAFANKGGMLKKGKGTSAQGRKRSISAKREAELGAAETEKDEKDEVDEEGEEDENGQEGQEGVLVEEEKSVFGAAIVGAAAGGWFAGPVGAAIGAVGASYASTWRDEGGVGNLVRQTGGYAVNALAGGQRMVRAAAVGARYHGQLSKWERTRKVVKTRAFFVTKRCEIVWLVCRGEMALAGCAFGVDVKGIESLCGAVVTAAVESPETAVKGGKKRLKKKGAALFWLEVVLSTAASPPVPPSRSETARRDSSLGITGSVRLLLAANSDVQRACWVHEIRAAVESAKESEPSEVWERQRQLTLEKQLTIGMGLQYDRDGLGGSNPLLQSLPQHLDCNYRKSTLGDEDVWAWEYEHSLGSAPLGMVGEGSVGSDALELAKEHGVARAVQLVTESLPGKPDDAAVVVACFLRIYNDQIGREAVGKYLGEGDDDDKVRIRMAFVRPISFAGKPFVEALRYYLSSCGFVLPGEAQKIERLIGAFVRRYWVDNRDGRDGIHSMAEMVRLAYLTLMLNDRLHNESKTTKKMSKQQFIEHTCNNRLCRGDEGDEGDEGDAHHASEDVPVATLEQLYDSIEAEEICIHGTHGADEGRGGTGGGTVVGAARAEVSIAIRVLIERLEEGQCSCTARSDQGRKLTSKAVAAAAEAGSYALHEATKAGKRALHHAAEAGQQARERVPSRQQVQVGIHSVLHSHNLANR